MTTRHALYNCASRHGCSCDRRSRYSADTSSVCAPQDETTFNKACLSVFTAAVVSGPSDSNRDSAALKRTLGSCCRTQAHCNHERTARSTPSSESACGVGTGRKYCGLEGMTPA